jgi:hypothetical protein
MPSSAESHNDEIVILLHQDSGNARCLPMASSSAGS